MQLPIAILSTLCYEPKSNDGTVQAGNTSMNIQAPPSPTLIGSVHRFGPHGVLYEVITILDNKRAMVRVIDTGEEAPYALDKIFSDPTD
jgi:hypothetical protein